MRGKFFGRSILIALIVISFFVGISLKEASAFSLRIVAADSSFPTSELSSTGFFSSIDTWNANASTPTLADLSTYDGVLAYTNLLPANAAALGDVLASYVDGGGKLVIATYAFSNPWGIAGTIATSGYSPLLNVAVNGDVTGNLNALVPGDSIFNDITLGDIAYFHNSNFAHPGLDAGATLLADDGSGINMIARNSLGNVIALNLYPVNYDLEYNAEFYKLVGNALVSETTSVPEPAFLLLFGSGVIALWGFRKRL